MLLGFFFFRIRCTSVFQHMKHIKNIWKANWTLIIIWQHRQITGHDPGIRPESSIFTVIIRSFSFSSYSATLLIRVMRKKLSCSQAKCIYQEGSKKVSLAFSQGSLDNDCWSCFEHGRSAVTQIEQRHCDTMVRNWLTQREAKMDLNIIKNKTKTPEPC